MRTINRHYVIADNHYSLFLRMLGRMNLQSATLEKRRTLGFREKQTIERITRIIAIPTKNIKSIITKGTNTKKILATNSLPFHM